MKIIELEVNFGDDKAGAEKATNRILNGDHRIGRKHAAYQTTEKMSFNHALQAIKEGHKVARSGWNGKSMWIALTPASTFPSVHAKEGHAAKHRADEFEEGGTVIHLNAHIDMKTADGSMCIGWLASQADMLSDDWCIVERT